MSHLPIILASSSPYRQQLLQRLQLPFNAVAPAIDESAAANESPEQLVLRLACSKAKALAHLYPAHLIIGSDQVSVRDNLILGKPHTHAAATAQLQAASGKTIDFYTGLAVFNSQSQQLLSQSVRFSVTFRNLTDAEIERYLLLEQPYDCAGSFKAEGLGISLFERMHGDDPSALIGLPLIQLCDFLRQFSVAVP